MNKRTMELVAHARSKAAFAPGMSKKRRRKPEYFTGQILSPGQLPAEPFGGREFRQYRNTVEENMEKAEYLKIQERVVAYANLVKDLPLKEFIEAGEKADAVGPLIDPTLWLQGHKNLGVVMNLARSLQEYQSKVIAILEKATAE